LAFESAREFLGFAGQLRPRDFHPTKWPKTAKAAVLELGRWHIADQPRRQLETGLWPEFVLPYGGLHRQRQRAQRGLAGSWCLETPTASRKGDGSVVQFQFDH
jgi:hypothetical protein